MIREDALLWLLVAQLGMLLFGLVLLVFYAAKAQQLSAALAKSAGSAELCAAAAWMASVACQEIARSHDLRGGVAAEQTDDEKARAGQAWANERIAKLDQVARLVNESAPT